LSNASILKELLRVNKLDDKEKITDLEAVTLLKKGYGLSYQDSTQLLKSAKKTLGLI
jgi:hypothetical protein